MKILRWSFLAILSIALSACGGRLTEQNVHKIKSGMPMQEARKLLGKPTEVGTAQMTNFDGTVDFYKKDKLEVRIVYMNDKVQMVFLNDTMIEQ